MYHMTQVQWSHTVVPARAASAARVIRLGLIAMVVLALSGMVTMPAARAQDGSAQAYPLGIVGGDGLDIAVLGMSTVDLGEASGTHLTLERVSVQPETVFQPRSAPEPALIVAESGSVLSEDERGFFSRKTAPFQTAITAGDASSWTASEPMTFLRLSMTEKPPAPSATEGVEVEVIASLVTNQVPAGAATFYIATASLAPTMSSVRLDQTGHTGVFVREGTVEVLSPSGLEGTLETGSSIIFPQSMPMNLLGTAGTEATALLFGITESPDASSLLTATVVDTCRNRQTSLCTPAGSALANGESWIFGDGSLTLNASTGGSETWVTNSEMRLDLVYVNEGASEVTFSVPAESITVAYESGEVWTLQDGTDRAFGIKPGGSDTMTLTFTPPEGAGEGIVVVSVPEFGGVSGARWQGVVETMTITPPEAMLAFGDPWMSETAHMTIDIRPATASESDQPERDIALDVTYTNIGSVDEVMTVSPSNFSVMYSAGGRWTSPSKAATARVEAGETQSFTFIYRGQPGRTQGDITVLVRELAGIEDARWEGPSPLSD
jgi:hypothetical protein